MKKLLLILLCLPMIGFCQDDKIIFSSGDTIYGKVIEVGVNDITYQHKDETTNNVSKKKELAKVIYSSGRTETFQGLSILESKIEREENDKLFLKKKKGNEIKYLYLSSGVIISDNKSEIQLSEYVSAELDNSSIMQYGIGYNFYNLKNLGFDFEINYITKNIHHHTYDTRYVTQSADNDYYMGFKDHFSNAKANFISFSIKNNLALITFSSLKLFFNFSPKIEFIMSESYSSWFANVNQEKGNERREFPDFNKLVYGSDLGFGMQKDFNKIVVKSNLYYAFTFTDIFDESKYFDNLNNEIRKSNLVLSFSIGRYL